MATFHGTLWTGEELYVLTAVSNLHKLYITRQTLTSPAFWYPCCWKELDESHTKWVCISLHMANRGPHPNASEIVTVVHLGV